MLVLFAFLHSWERTMNINMSYLRFNKFTFTSNLPLSQSPHFFVSFSKLIQLTKPPRRSVIYLFEAS